MYLVVKVVKVVVVEEVMVSWSKGGYNLASISNPYNFFNLYNY